MNRARDLLITTACRVLSVLFSLGARPLRANRSFSSIVIVKPCCIGDVTLATATVAALRQTYPQAHIAFAVSSWAREAIAGNPRLDEIIDCGNVGSGRGYSWREYLSLVDQIRRGHFELAVILERSPILSLIPFLSGVPHRAGIDSSGRGFALTIKAPWTPSKGNRHEAELYLDVVRALGVDPGGARAEFYPSSGDREKAAAVLAGATRQLGQTGPNSKLAMIHPGGAANPGMVLSAKRWLPERYAAIARRFGQQGWTVVAAGADSDRAAADAVLAGMSDEAGVVDLVGKLSLGEFAAVAQCCSVFVGNDTGPMHVAAAVGTPTVAIFGPSTPEMYAPYGPKVATVYKRVACSPCFVKGRFDASCRDFKCMQAVGVEDVWEAIQRVLAE